LWDLADDLFSFSLILAITKVPSKKACGFDLQLFGSLTVRPERKVKSVPLELAFEFNIWVAAALVQSPFPEESQDPGSNSDQSQNPK
jgi:hypothetical protein